MVKTTSSTDTINRELTDDEIEAFAADVAEQLYQDHDAADKLMILMLDIYDHKGSGADLILAKRLFMETRAGRESLRRYTSTARVRLLPTKQSAPEIAPDTEGGIN